MKTAVCSHSIGAVLSKKLALLTMIVIGSVFAASWFSIKMLIVEKNGEDLAFRSGVIARILEEELRGGGLEACLVRLKADAPMRASSRLELFGADGRVIYADAESGPHALSRHSQAREFTVAAPGVEGGLLKARYTMDFAADAKMGQSWIVVIVGLTLLAGAIVGLGAFARVRRQLRPLEDLAAQTRAISPRRLDQRLSLADPAEELLPWIEQFNALMGRLEQAYAQLEGFNADVAHELRTPLASLIGHTEVALSRERSADALRETLVSNLEELHRLSAMVNDMLFLSQSDRGAVARRGDKVSLAALAGQVVEFHEASAEEAKLTVAIEGDVVAAVDEPLFKRAVSNLLGNALRFAEPGSRVLIRIAPDAGGSDAAADQVRVEVQNAGPTIEPQNLSRLFDRFFRADVSRCCDGEEQHHGLGLAIVAAIARMHAGRPLAESSAGTTRVGFTLAAG